MIVDDSLLLAKEKANVWDSKKVIQKESFVFLDTGEKLEASEKIFWKLMVWDNRNMRLSLVKLHPGRWD